MSVLFTTFWGALYLIVLLVTMLPALWFYPRRRLLAGTMLLLAALDRIAVTTLPAELALAFLAFAYFALAAYLAIGHPQTRRNAVVAFCLTVIAAALIGGSFGVLSWDTTGTIQEAFGAIAMGTIIWPNRHGHRVPDAEGQADHPRGGHRASSGTVAQRQTDEGHSETHRPS